MRRGCYWALWGVARAAFAVWFRMSVDGAPRPVPGGPLVVAANHCSYLDPVLLCLGLRRRITFLVTVTVYRQWHMRPWMWLFGCIPVHDDRSNRDALRQAVDLLKRGHAVGIFPEGGISRDGRLQEGAAGVASMILQAGASVLPGALVGPHQSMPLGARFPKPVKLEVHWGPCLAPTEWTPGLRGAPARAEVRDRVMDEIARRLPAAQQPHPTQ